MARPSRPMFASSPEYRTLLARIRADLASAAPKPDPMTAEQGARIIALLEELTKLVRSAAANRL